MDEKVKHRSTKRQSMLRPLTIGANFGNWMFDVVADLVAPPTAAVHTSQYGVERPVTRFVPPPIDISAKRRPISVIVESPTSPSKRPLSLQFTPTSTTFTLPSAYYHSKKEEELEEEEFEQEKKVVIKSAGVAQGGRGQRQRGLTTAVDEKGRLPQTIPEEEPEHEEEEEEQRHPFWATNRAVWPTVPYKPLLFLGLAVSIASGAITPVFSFLLSRLLFEVSIGARNVGLINKFGGIVLAIAAADGLLLGSKYFIMEYCGLAWVTKLRSVAFNNLLKQDTKFFDKRPQNSAAKLVQVLVKDAEDARNLIAIVWCQFLVVATMLGVGLIWAMIRGWQLTLVGLAVAPVFAGVMTLQTSLVAKCELRNKRAREDVAKGYYEAIINVRGIRAMAFEKLFWDDFDKATNRALTTGVRGAFVEGCTYGVASGLIYLAEALLFYVGAVLIAKGTYTYLQMVEVLNLVVFTVTIGSQLMAFSMSIVSFYHRSILTFTFS
jgi:ATP-binding cassette subfamily B (MDR/TAP) protein 1